jgi:hypothetical protein
MTEEHTKKESAVAKYNKCIDEAMAARSSVKVRPGVIPMRVGTGSLFCKLAGPSGNVEE